MKRNYIKGMFVGSALGNTLGSQNEQYKLNTEYTDKLYQSITRNTQLQGEKLGIDCKITNDTEITIAILESLVNNKGVYNKSDVIHMYCKFVNNCSFLGNNTRALFHCITTLRGLYNRFVKFFSEQNKQHNMQSNGCLMRTFSLVLAINKSEAMKDVTLTISNKVCNDVINIYVTALSLLIDNYALDLNNKRSLIISYLNDVVKEKLCDDSVIEIILDIQNKQNRKIDDKDKGCILHSFYLSLFAFFYFDSFSKAIDYVINMGGDTAANAYITGSLFGCLIGYDKLLDEQGFNINIMQSCDQTKSDYEHCYSYNDGIVLIDKLINILSLL